MAYKIKAVYEGGRYYGFLRPTFWVQLPINMTLWWPSFWMMAQEKMVTGMPAMVPMARVMPMRNLEAPRSSKNLA